MVKTYFTDIRKAIIEALESAEVEILVAVYWFTNQELFEILSNKLKRGVNVSLIIHNDYCNNREGGLDFQSFVDLGGLLYFSENDRPMHNKFCIIDKAILINGSYNWTYYSEDRNRENILVIINENETLLAFRNEFLTLVKSLNQVNKVGKMVAFLKILSEKLI